MRKTLLLSLILLSAPSCRTINKDALNAFQAGEQAMMKDLIVYRGQKPTQDIQDHLAKAQDPKSIPPNEENALFAELLAAVLADPKLSDDRKKTYPERITSHLKLYNSIHGN